MTTSGSSDGIIVADVGGTHVRFAQADGNAGLHQTRTLLCADFANLESALDAWLAGLPAAPEIHHLCLAVPGPAQVDPITLVNNPWQISGSSLRKRYRCSVTLLNDFTAQAYSLPALPAQQLHWLRAPRPAAPAPTRLILGPGTGLGVAALLADGTVVESEAGHIGFAPVDQSQREILAILEQELPRVSVERLLSGPGLANIFRAQQKQRGFASQLQAEAISAGARQGDDHCRAAVTEFCRILGAVSGDLALAFSAIGGVYLSGGLLAGLDELFDPQLFLQQFDHKGRFSDFCTGIPVARILHPDPGLLGAARFALQQLPANA